METSHYKELLSKENERLEKELANIGHKNPNNPLDWQADHSDIDIEKSDVIDTADNIEELAENSAIVNELEVRLNNIKAALERITSGTYGICLECNKQIEEDRLTANPSASTCKEHMK